MLRLEVYMLVQDLHRQGHSIRHIARLTGLARNSVRSILRTHSPTPPAYSPRGSCLDEFKPYLTQRYQATGLSAVRLLAEVQPMGYSGSVDVLRRFLRHLDAPQRALRSATVRFETPPGEQAQADWAFCGRFQNAAGQMKKVYAFVIVLSYSRYLYLEFTTDMSLPTLLTCHQNAFAYFGGWPRTILYDNMKQVRLNPWGDWTPLCLDFLHYYGINPRTHQPGRPRTKGKIERQVHYVKDNFLLGREFADLPDLRAQGRHWLDQTANIRLHATTQACPLDLWAQEGLTPYASLPPYPLTTRHARVVNRESFVQVARSRYSVPPQYVGQEVVVALGEQQVVIRKDDLIIATHPVAPRPGACLSDPAHIAALWRLTLTQTPAPALAPLLWQETVDTRPLTVYEEVAA